MTHYGFLKQAIKSNSKGKIHFLELFSLKSWKHWKQHFTLNDDTITTTMLVAATTTVRYPTPCNKRGVYRQKVPCFTPNSFVMVNYKTFHLKHYIVFVKICPPTGQITFWPTPLKIEFSKLFYHRHVGCLSRGIEGTCSKITFFPYIALVVLKKSLKNNFFFAL